MVMASVALFAATGPAAAIVLHMGRTIFGAGTDQTPTEFWRPSGFVLLLGTLAVGLALIAWWADLTFGSVLGRAALSALLDQYGTLLGVGGIVLGILVPLALLGLPLAMGTRSAWPASIALSAALIFVGGYAAMAVHALNGLVGSVDHAGGTLAKMKTPDDKYASVSDYQDEVAAKKTKLPKIDQRGTLAFPSMKKGKSGGGVVTNPAADGMLAKDPMEIKVLLGYWCNFSCSGSGRWDEALSNLPFFAHATTHYSEMTHFADLVLPAAHQMFEKWGFLKSKQNLHTYMTLNVPVIQPIADLRMDEIEMSFMLAPALAERGFDKLLRYYTENYPDTETGTTPENATAFTLAALKTLTRGAWDSTHENYGKYGEELDGWDDFVKKEV